MTIAPRVGRRLLGLAAAAMVVLPAAPAAAQACRDNRLAVQTLGSGGPFPSDSASSGYLVWRDGRSVALVDAGGGVFQRFGQAGGRVDQLGILALSHLHPDHVSDVPALLWLTDHRTEPLTVAGPSGGGLLPPVDVFLARLVGESASALPIVFARGVPLAPVTVDAQGTEPVTVLDEGGLEVSALPVPHGNVPALAYRIRVDGRTFVFGGDQNGSSPRFVEFARDADVLVMHMSLSPAATDAQLTGLHATPDAIGRIAAAAEARGLVLSHVVAPRPEDPQGPSFARYDQATAEASAAAVRSQYGGTLVVAQDLQCLAMPE